MPLIAKALIVLPSNSTTEVLASSATYTGTAEKMAGDSFLDQLWFWSRETDSVITVVYTDQPGTLYMEQSTDGTNWDSSLSYDVEANSNEFHRLTVTRQYFRVRFTNTGTSTQTYIRLQTMTGDSTQVSTPQNIHITDDADSLLVRSANEEEIMQGKIKGSYLISKYGANTDVDAAEDINDSGGDYTGQPTAAAENFEVLSSSEADTNTSGTGARQLQCFYLNDDYEMFDSNGVFLSFTVNLAGQSVVDSGVSGMRIWRCKVILSGSGGTNAGVITVRWATTESVIFTTILVGYGQSEITAFTIPAGYTGYLRRFGSQMTDNQASNTAQMILRYRDFGSNTYRRVRPYIVGVNANYERRFYGGDKLEEKTDFLMRALSVGSANAVITGDYAILLIKN